MPMMMLVKNVDGTYSEKPVRGTEDGGVAFAQIKNVNRRFKNYALLQTLEPVAAFNTSHTDVLGLIITVEDNALNQLQVYAQYSKNSGWVDLSLVNANYTTPIYPVLKSNITNVAVVPVGTFYLHLDVKAFHRIMILAASSSASFSKVVISTGNDDLPLPRRIKNDIPISRNKLSNFNPSLIGDGTVTYDDVAGTVVCTTSTSGRVLFTHTFTSVVGEYYAMSVDVLAKSGTFGQYCMSIAGGLTNDEGILNITIPTAVGTRMMMIFRASSATVGALARWGIGVITPETNACSLTLAKFMFQRLGKSLINLGEYVPCGHAYLFDNYKDNYWDSSAKTFIEGSAVPFVCNSIYSGLVTGDSFANDGNDFNRQLELSLGNGTIPTYSTSGITLATIAANFAAYFENNRPRIKAADAGDVVIIPPVTAQPVLWGVMQGGVNDIQQVGSATANPIPAMQSNFKIIHAKLVAEMIQPIAINVGPWSGFTSFSLTTNDQMHTIFWNAWLAEYCTANSIPLIDIYTALGDPAAPTALLLAYNSGDGLHPNTAGFKVIGDLIAREIMKFV